jgi:hypothetical protein
VIAASLTPSGKLSASRAYVPSDKSRPSTFCQRSADNDGPPFFSDGGDLLVGTSKQVYQVVYLSSLRDYTSKMYVLMLCNDLLHVLEGENI